MRIRLVVAALVLAGAIPVPQLRAQDAEGRAVLAVVQQLFDGMRTRDTTAMRALFAPHARMIRVTPRGEVRNDPPDGWLASVARAPAGLLLDERTSDHEVRVDGDIAQAWMKFVFYSGERLSHCGVNAFEFVRLGGAWKVISVMDTQRTEGCAPGGMP